MANEVKKVWFITGSSTGFGRAVAEAAAARGDRVVATARKIASLADLAAKYPDHVKVLPLDVTDAAQRDQAVKAALAAFGRIDVLLNNAGYGLLGAVEEATLEQTRRLFETNFFGLLEVTRAVLPVMRAQKSGHVLNVSSVGGVVSFPALGPYHATKYAVEGLSETLAQEVAGFGVKVTLIEPGAFRTDWSGRSMEHAPQLEAYAGSPAALVRQYATAGAGKEAGDPVRAAAAILSVVDDATPPLRLPLGADALAGIRKKLERELANLDARAPLANSTQFPAPGTP